jgi:hypothetical protein
MRDPIKSESRFSDREISLSLQDVLFDYNESIEVEKYAFDLYRGHIPFEMESWLKSYLERLEYSIIDWPLPDNSYFEVNSLFFGSELYFDSSNWWALSSESYFDPIPIPFMALIGVIDGMMGNRNICYSVSVIESCKALTLSLPASHDRKPDKPYEKPIQHNSYLLWIPQDGKSLVDVDLYFLEDEMQGSYTLDSGGLLFLGILHEHSYIYLPNEVPPGFFVLLTCK